MMFRFRLQRVLEIREQKEKEVATQLVLAQSEANAAREACERLEASRLASRDELEQQSTLRAASVGELRNMAFLLQQMDERLTQAEEAALAAEATVARTQDELIAAFKDRHVMDKLRTRREEAFRAESASADRNLMDAIALSRYVQSPDVSPSANKPGER
jgi:flagellar FliJ protein